MTLRLNIQYLWIDSICIVQDDKEDWLQESTAMADIFQGSRCTIAVDSACDSSKGFLSNQREIPRAVRFKHKDERVEFFFSDYGNFQTDVEGSALNSRAWVLQERLLSRRTIHFTSGQIYWECGSNILSESGQSSFSQRLKMLRDFKNRTHFASIPRSWYFIIEKYSDRKLSEEADKLVAIAGVVSRFQERTTQLYHAGLWMDEFHKGLLWLNCGQLLSRPKSYRAPSWSWASCDGPIQYYLNSLPRDTEVYVQLLPTAMHCTTRDASGHSAFPRLQIATSLRKVPSFGNYLDEAEMCNWDLDYHTCCQMILDENGRIGIGWAAFDDKEPISTDTELWCARIARGDVIESDTDDDDSDVVPVQFYYVLLLRGTIRWPQGGPVQYERVGLGVITVEDWFNESPARLFSLI